MLRRMGRNDLCWCGSGRKYKVCHMAFDEKIKSYAKQGKKVPKRSLIKTPAQVEGIRESGKRNIAILDYVAERIQVGMSTEEINRMVVEKTKELKGIAAPLHFEEYPKSVCTSLNDEICHGIPSKDVILREGDILNVDATTIYNGYYSDSSRMFCIGQVSEERQRLVRVTRECMLLGLEQVKPWGFLGDMGSAVYEHARKNGYTVVREIGGHGVGLAFHEEPWVGYTTRRGTEMLLVPGMVFTIEPMINMGRCEMYIDKRNGWTARTRDGKPSAQWEITVLVTENGHEILAY